MERYLCLHLHFYQPPRENPWLETIEYQDSAYPFHDWNERINSECYRTNGEAKILNHDGEVVDLVNNYAKVSFNFGPTLLSWLEEKDPRTYELILEGDRESRRLFGGHGAAIAQAFNHIIMPLANRRDKEAQVLWGLRDFESRFKRPAEAMWLPETAVDTETLEILAANGMKYVILAPRQAQAVRSLERTEVWRDVSGERIDPKKPYWIRLPSGRSIAGFFYDGPISKAVAFEGLLHNGEKFANRLLQGFSDHVSTPQLLHIATDGETYGHHHRHGEMALAYALFHMQSQGSATITNYGQFLDAHPPRDEARIVENSSWSCIHGVERWKGDCGCSVGSRPGWHQRWRAPLRAAFELVRERTGLAFERALSGRVTDPWAMRNDYDSVVRNRSMLNIESFVNKWLSKSPPSATRAEPRLEPQVAPQVAPRLASRSVVPPTQVPAQPSESGADGVVPELATQQIPIEEPDEILSDEQVTQILKALESQLHCLYMFTSCAWFFDEISGLEAVQSMRYAFRAIELAESAFGISLLDDFLHELEKAESNLPEHKNGRDVFERLVRPARVDALHIGVHFALASIFRDVEQTNEVYGTKITLLRFDHSESGKARLVSGRARIRTRATLERRQMTFAAVYFGDHNVAAGVRYSPSDDAYDVLLSECRSAFVRADFPSVIRILDRSFAGDLHSIKDLFRDEQRRIVNLVLSETMAETEERFVRLYRANTPFLAALSDLQIPLPRVFGAIAEFVQDRGVRRALGEENINFDLIRKYVRESAAWGVRLDESGLTREFENALERLMERLVKDPTLRRLDDALLFVELCKELPFRTDLGFSQVRFYQWLRSRAKDAPGSALEMAWARRIQRLARHLGIRVPADSQRH